MNTWKSSFLGYLEPRLFIVLFLGFSSGLPYGMLIDPLNFWLSESGISRTAIGLLSWITLTYSFKAIWSPFIDKFKIPLLANLLGQRKSWLVLSQAVVVLALFGMAFSDPVNSILTLVGFALIVGFASATQDICIDAMRIELVTEKELGEASAMYQGGWRLAFLLTQVATFLIASLYDWSTAYNLAAVLMIAVIFLSIFKVPEPKRSIREHISIINAPGEWFADSYLVPFKDFYDRWKGQFFLTVLLIICYRFSDIILGPMAMPFYQETGFTKEEVALITNAFGILVTVLGIFFGGLMVFRSGIMRTLFLGAVMVCLTNLSFAALDTVGHELSALTAVIALDNFSQGLAGTALIAYLSSLTNQNFTATQYALLFLLATVPAKLLAGASGVIVDSIGFFNFFLYASFMGIPAIFLSYYLIPEEAKS
jgi:PAT family beta-lactamase induction signal transducer AmpG